MFTVRSKNEKVARAIRNVKDNPDIINKVDKLVSQGKENLESQIKSDRLNKVNADIESQRLEKEKVELEA